MDVPGFPKPLSGTHDVEGFLYRMCDTHGFQGAIFTTSAPNRGSLLFATDASWPWLPSRGERRDHDPVHEVVQQSQAPVCWSILLSNDTTRGFLAEVLRHGAGPRGISLPLHGPLGATSVMSVSSAMPQAEWNAHVATRIPALQAMGAHIAQIVQSEISKLHALCSSGLSRREIDALRLIASERSDSWRRGPGSGLKRAVVVDLASARHKLGALTNGGAVTRAAKLGLLQSTDVSMPGSSEPDL